MILYGSSLSPFVRKVLVFAAEKGVALELKPTGLNAQDPEFLEASPFRKIPAFRDGDFTLADSSAIIAYLDALNPDPSLIPTDARARAKTVWFEEFADTLLMTCGAKMFFNRIVSPLFLKRPGNAAMADEAEATEFPPLLDYLEGVIPASGFLVEDRLTLADIAVAAPFVNFGHLGLEWRSGRPKLAAYIGAILARPAFTRWTERETAFLERARAA